LEQHSRYEKLLGRIQSAYSQLKPFICENDLTPFWSGRVHKIGNLIAEPLRFDFMHYPDLRWTIGIDTNRLPPMAAWLDEKLPAGSAQGILIEEDIGGLPVFTFRGKAVSADVIKFLYYTMLFGDGADVRIDSVSSVIEWGGGFGGHAKVFKRLGNEDLTYTIIDLPPLCLVQWVYLSVIFGEDAVNLITKGNEEVELGKINLVPASLAKGMTSSSLGSPELFISLNALSECHGHVVRYVVEERDWFNASHICIYTKAGNLPEGSRFFNFGETMESFGVEKVRIKGTAPGAPTVRSR